jgi:hypothetical protein
MNEHVFMEGDVLVLRNGKTEIRLHKNGALEMRYVASFSNCTPEYVQERLDSLGCSDASLPETDWIEAIAHTSLSAGSR